MNKTLLNAKDLKYNRSVTEIMLLVMVALIPGSFCLFYFFGPGILVSLLIANSTAIAYEALMLKLNKKPVLFNLSDCSALVTATLIAICLPPLAPWWLTIIATGFAIVIAKHLYGGLGHNIFNPAMIGYVVVLISFPGPMTQWIEPDVQSNEIASSIIAKQLLESKNHKTNIDAISSATPLDLIKTELERGRTLTEIKSTKLFGNVAGIGWEWVNFAFLIGGLFLIYKKIITWHIPIAMLSTLFILSNIFYSYDSDAFSSPIFHLFSGGTMLAAFFIATDPVTSCASIKGRLLFGFGVAIYTFIIRTWGGYPDGLAFAILLMNMKVPTIDYFIKPTSFGHKNQGDKQ